jgi:hypothetical protein
VSKWAPAPLELLLLDDILAVVLATVRRAAISTSRKK